MPRHTNARKVLVLRGPTLETQGILSLLEEHFDVEVADDLPQALKALREGSFSAILSETADLIPLQIGVVTDEVGSLLDRTGRELANLNRETLVDLDTTQRVQVLTERILSSAREMLEFEYFSILILDRLASRLKVLVSEGPEHSGTTRERQVGTEGDGICGFVAASGRSYICPEVREDPRYLMGLTDARSALTVPINLRGKVVGVFNVESRRPGAFGEQDQHFGEIFANYLAIAMHVLNLLAPEDDPSQGSAVASLCAELAGPLNDIVTETTEAMEDYIGHDDLRNRLQSVINRARDASRLIHSRIVSGPTETRQPDRRSEPDATLGGKTVLVADDEEMMRLTIRDVLISCGSAVDIACDGEEAVQLLKSRNYDLVISDIKMPGATGYEVFAAAKEASSATQVILITAFGYDPHHSAIRAGAEGLAAVLMKPFKANKLLSECRSALSPRPM
jgi:CheY-like chemotaxis protein